MSKVIIKSVLGIYFLAGLVLPPLTALIFLFHPRGRRRILERFGLWHLGKEEIVWFHGASVGEVLGLLPIITEYKKNHPQDKILLTAASPTGLDIAKDAVDYKKLLPFDNVCWLKFALDNLKIKAFIFGETEIWPALLLYLARRNVPTVMVNGRFSEQSVKFWSTPLLKGVILECMQKISYIFAGNKKYQDNFIACGALPNKVVNNGNSKFDRECRVKDKETALDYKRKFFVKDYPVFVVGSLRVGEEEILFPAIKESLGLGEILFVVAPRHQEKMNYFADKLKDFNISFERRSELSKEKKACSGNVLLLDTLGELEIAYSFASAAFIGGTLVPKIGGHNPLEAAAYGVALCMGKYRHNIDNIADELKDSGGLVDIENKDDLLRFLFLVNQQDQTIQKMSDSAKVVWQNNRGACQRIIEKLASLIN